ncbi:ribonuclease H-like domain-containing protein [Tanacetum coccineum]
MISMRLKKFYKKTSKRLHFDAKEPVGFDKTKVECYNCHNTGHFTRECRSKENQDSRRRDAGNTRYRAKDNEKRPGKQEEPKALVALDGEGVDWNGHAEDEQENFALMAYSNSGSDIEVKSCSKECVESYAKLKKLYDEQREQLGNASIEIQSYTQALKKVEAQLVTHQKNQLWYEEKIRFMKIDLDDKTDVLTYHKKLLAEAVKEKEELKTKLKNFQSSSKGLSKLLNSQMSTRDKSRLGYGDQIHNGALSYENEVFQSVVDSRSSDVEGSHVHDRFVNVEGMHAVPPPIIGNYMPSGPDKEVDDSMFTYGPKQSKTSESDTQTSNYDSFWSDALIIEEYNSDSDDEYVIQPSKEQEKFKRTGKTYFSHLIRDCDFHEKRMAKQVELNKKKGKGTGQGDNRSDNPQRALKNKGIVDSGCSRHMTGNKAYLVEYQDYNGSPVAFGGSKGQITDSECVVMSPDFKLPDENQVLLRVPRQNNMYSFNLENIVPTRGLACLIAKATVDESNKWYRRLGHNEANKTAGPEEANHSAGTQDNVVAGNSEMEADPAQDYFVLPIYSSYTSTNKKSEAKNEGVKHTKDTGLKTNEERVDQEDQAFLEELERLKRQEKEANDAAEVLRKEFAQSTEDLLLQAGAARATGTNTVNTVSTPLSTANPSNVFSTGGPSYLDLTNYANQDDS